MPELEPRLISYLYFFNVKQDYFECHEYLESLWLDTGRPQVLQGLIQAAVCLYHLHNGNVRGASRMWGRGKPRLVAACPHFLVINLADLIAQLDHVFSLIPERIHNQTVTPQEVLRLGLPRVEIPFVDKYRKEMEQVLTQWVPQPLPEEE